MQNTGQLVLPASMRLAVQRWLLTALGGLALLLSGAAQAQAPSGDNGLDSQVRQWVSARQNIAAGAVQLLPLDARLQTRPCQSMWLIDQPFPQQPDTVRARCTQPVWQVFVRVAGAPPPGPSAQAAAPAAPDMRTVVVASGLLQRGTRIQAEQVELAERDARTLGGVVVERVEDVLHAELVRDIPAGAVLRGSDIRPAWLIRKGQLVQLSWSPTPGFQISARVEALDNGRMGEPVRLKNRDSGRIISGVVTGLGTVAGL